MTGALNAHIQNEVNHCLNVRRLDAVVRWDVLDAGLTNHLFTGYVECQSNPKYVLRINAEGVIGIDRERESRILSVLKDFAWSPNRIAHNDKTGWSLIEAYQTFPANAELPHIYNESLLSIVEDYQSLTLYPSWSHWSIEYHTLINHYQESAAKCSLETDRSGIIEKIATFKRDYPALPVLPQCLVHHDLHMGNVCLEQSGKKGGQLKLLDWEYAGLGNAWFDAHALVNTLKIPSDEVKLLPAYNMLSEQEWQDGLTGITRVSHLLDELWYWQRSLCS